MLQGRQHTRVDVIKMFAEEGPNAIPFLTEKLRATRYQATIIDILRVFWRIALGKRYNFSNDQELLVLLNQKVEDMSTLKGMALEMITQIRVER